MFSSNTSQVSAGGGYEIQRSLRFNSADSAYLNRTPASAGNRRTWTWSAWVKRGSLTTVSGLTFFNQGGVSSNYTLARFTVSGNLDFQSYGTSAFNFQKISTAVYRDLSAWYHIVFVLDATNTQARIYVNGEEVAYSTNVNPANTDQLFNQAALNRIGYTTDNLLPFDGYMTEVNFIDGQALTPSSFGEFNADTGVWQPKRYAGSYGTNGFYLNFSNNSNTTAATLGADYSGNGNNWTPNNFSVSAGAGNDSLVDVPTNWGVDTGVGGSVRGNYCTLNPLTTTSGTYTQGNLRYTGPSNWRRSNATISRSTGQWYWEVTLGNAPFSRSSNSEWNAFGFGVATSFGSVTPPSVVTDAVVLTDSGYYKNFSGSFTDGGTAFANGDVLSVAVDLDANTYTFRRNNTQIVTGTIGGTAGRELVPIILSYDGQYGVMDCNFGQRPFAYTAPSGFRALNTQNLPTPTIGATPATQAGKFFNPVLYTGNGSARSISGVGFQPDWVWIKSRSGVFNHGLNDAVRGAGKFLYSDLTAVEGNFPTDFASFDSDGFSLGSATGNITNGSGQTYVAWNWRANGAGVTNTAGSITSTVSANTTSGFSVVTFTAPTSGNFSVGHGLGVAPSMVITKRRDSASQWWVWHIGLGDNTTDYLSLNTTNAELSATNMWGTVGRNSTVMGYNSGVSIAGDSTQVAYCFAEVPGYSRFGSYTGNGSTDAPFVYTGFRPAYVMIKGTSSGAADTFWIIFDSKRNTFNLTNLCLATNNSDAEFSNDTVVSIDLLSNGFKVRASNTSFGINQPNNVYVFAAFAEAPQKFALAR